MPADQIQHLDVSSWSRRNISTNAAGELMVRPGLRVLGAKVGTGSHVAGFSLRSDLDDLVHSYLAYTDSDGSCSVAVLNENLEVVSSHAWGFGPPAQMTHGVVNGRVVVASPGKPTLFGFVGGALTPAVARETGLNIVLSNNPVPQGICVGWANRIVYSTGTGLYFSDAGDPLSIVGTNVQNPPGATVRGLHVGANGSLYVVTADGVWSQSREAAMAGQVVLGVWRRESDYRATSFSCSTTVRGRLWGVTQRGVMLIDTPDPYEVMLAEPSVKCTVGGPLAGRGDMRAGTQLFGGADGLLIAQADRQQLCVMDDVTRTFSWWTPGDNLAQGLGVVGVMESYHGEQVLVTREGFCTPLGNAEGDSVSSLVGLFLGRVPTHPGDSRNLRSVQVSSDTSDVVLAVANGQLDSGSPPIETGAVVLGTNADLDGTWRTPPMRSVEMQFTARTDEHSLLVGANRPMDRIARTVSVVFSGISPRRVTN